MDQYKLLTNIFSVKSVARIPMGGGGSGSGSGVNLLTEYRHRVANIGLTFWDAATGEWMYNFPFAVVNGDVIPQVEGIIPNTYRITGSAVSANGALTFFSGETTVEVVIGSDNHARLVLEPCSTVGASFAVKDLPAAKPHDVQINSITANNDRLSSYDYGYMDGDVFRFWAQVQLYPEPAVKMRYFVQDGGGKVYSQEINFYILDLIDTVIANGRYEITYVYVPSTKLTVDVVFPVSLNVSLASDTQASGIAFANEVYHKFTKVNFTAGSSDVPIDAVTVQMTGLVDDKAFAELAFIDATNGGRITPIRVLDSNHQAVFEFGSPLIIPAYTTKSYYLVANMARDLGPYAGQVAYLSLVGVKTSASIIGNLPITGNSQVMNASYKVGSYTVSLDTSTLGARTIAAGTSGNVMTKLRFTAEGEMIDVDRIPLSLSDPNSSCNDVSQVYIYDGSNLIGQGFLGIGNAQGGTANAQMVFYLTTPLRLVPGIEKVITIKADVTPIYTVNTIATSGHAIAIDFVGSTDPAKNSGVGYASGVRITTNSQSTHQTPAYIFKSKLTVSALPLPTATLQNGTNVLYRFSERANDAGDIDVFRRSFRISWSDELMISTVVLMNESDGTVIGPLTDYSGPGEYSIDSLHTVAAASTGNFVLMAQVNGVRQGSKVVVYMLGDQVAINSQTIAAFKDRGYFGAENTHFIWSDRSGLSSWNNGALVDGFPLSISVLTK